jgi:hypothetical protein
VDVFISLGGTERLHIAYDIPSSMTGYSGIYVFAKQTVERGQREVLPPSAEVQRTVCQPSAIDFEKVARLVGNQPSEAAAEFYRIGARPWCSLVRAAVPVPMAREQLPGVQTKDNLRKL